jgi:hypothetical protein
MNVRISSITVAWKGEVCRARALLAGVAGHDENEACGKPADYKLAFTGNLPSFVCGDCLGSVIEGLRDDRCAYITPEGWLCGEARTEHPGVGHEFNEKAA